MATTADTIIDAAVDSSDSSERNIVADDAAEILGVLNRLLFRFYTLLGTPEEQGGASQGDFFATTTTVTINASVPPSLATAAWRHLFEKADGTPVAVVTRLDLSKGRAELPPAIVIESGKVRSAGRTGDPVDTDVLTVRYTPLPGTMTKVTDFIGATTPVDAGTTLWPEHVGNPWLIAELRQYFAIKRGDAQEDELADIREQREASATALAQFVGMNATRLIEEQR